MVKINSLIAFYLFLLLEQKPRHGYELIKELSGKLDREVSASHIYPLLGRMAKEKLIAVKSFGGRKKKVYFLTVNGRMMTRKLLSRFSSLIEVAIGKKISKCHHCGCEVYGKAYAKKVGGRLRKFCCRYCAEGCKKC